ncbi:uncharacterized protein RCC_03125 [Ramularia collo-cygni]|uniref:SMP domain-containing protein n=1 Tax=Ramularia collo-cygni TaxID=112498 RepID=A0A2D3UPI8_9PEZI|nr:uncharacterized protein RCC_03125 [Ramularia collo-cygni]CZT17291.1 uncharacterized protein RCC_03125 [Ramularia collo-cygni]
MSSTAVTKPQSKEVYQTPDGSGVIEEKEASSKASASAGLNLNVFGAVAGMLSSKSSKSTDEDGSIVETRENQAQAQGAAAGNLNARAAADAEQHGRQMRAAIEERNGS